MTDSFAANAQEIIDDQADTIGKMNRDLSILKSQYRAALAHIKGLEENQPDPDYVPVQAELPMLG